MILEQSEQKKVTDLMVNYRHLHDEIARIEVTIKDFEKSLQMLYKDKDAVVKGIEDARDNESTVIKGLVDKYGDGKLNLANFEWVTDETKSEQP